MARKIAGEASLRIGARSVRLRLDIGTMMDLEDYLGTGLVLFLTTRFSEFRLTDLATLFLAMTGGDFTNDIERRKAGEKLLQAGLAEATTAISSCLEATLSPGKTQPPKEGAMP